MRCFGTGLHKRAHVSSHMTSHMRSHIRSHMRFFTRVDFVCRGEPVQGLFIRCLRHESYAYGTTFISNVSDAQRCTVFVTIQDIRGPAFEVITTSGHRVVRLPNIWEID